MSYPWWPQSKYVYRPRMNNMAPTSYGFGAMPTQKVGGGAIGGHYYPSRARHGALSPDDWAIPSYVRTNEGLGDTCDPRTQSCPPQQFQLLVVNPAAVSAAQGSLGTGKCFEPVWNRLRELTDYAAGQAPYGMQSLVQQIFDALIAKLDKALFSKIWNVYQQNGGKAGAKAFIASNAVAGLTLFPSGLLDQLSRLGGGAMIDTLADYVANWLDARIKECETGVSATADRDAILACGANGTPLTQCPLPSLGGKSAEQRAAEQKAVQAQAGYQLVQLSPVLGVANPSAVSAAVLADQKVAAALQQQQQQQPGGGSALPLVAGAAALAFLLLRR